MHPFLSVTSKRITVQRMTAIYEHVSRVGVWLGLYKSLFKELIESVIRSATQLWTSHLRAKVGRQDDRKHSREGSLMNRPWFTRTWVLQEATVLTSQMVGSMCWRRRCVVLGVNSSGRQGSMFAGRRSTLLEKFKRLELYRLP